MKVIFYFGPRQGPHLLTRARAPLSIHCRCRVLILIPKSPCSRNHLACLKEYWGPWIPLNCNLPLGAADLGLGGPNPSQIHSASLRSSPGGHWILINLRHQLLPSFSSYKNKKKHIFFPCYACLGHPTRAYLRQNILQELLKLFSQWLLRWLSNNCAASPVFKTAMFVVSSTPSEAIATTEEQVKLEICHSEWIWKTTFRPWSGWAISLR